LPGYRIAKHPLRYASAKLQPDLLFGPIAPQFQSAFCPNWAASRDAAGAFHSASESLFLVPFSRAISTADPFLEESMLLIVALSEERVSQIKALFP
jgi:hypothetical protein